MSNVDIVKIIALGASLVITSGVSVSASAAESFQSHESIHTLVHDYMTAQLEGNADIRFELSIDTLNPQFTLNACDKPLRAYTATAINPFNDNRASVGVACDSDKPWSVYIPVSIKRFANVLVATQHLQRGRTLTAQDFEASELELTQLMSGYFLANTDIVGMQTTRPVRAGTVYSRNSIRNPDVVKKGEHIIIVANQVSFTVRMKGEALSDGQLGERIKVRNSSSKRTVEAIVISPGIVEVTM